MPNVSSLCLFSQVCEVAPGPLQALEYPEGPAETAQVNLYATPVPGSASPTWEVYTTPVSIPHPSVGHLRWGIGCHLYQGKEAGEALEAFVRCAQFPVENHRGRRRVTDTAPLYLGPWHSRHAQAIPLEEDPLLLDLATDLQQALVSRASRVLGLATHPWVAGPPLVPAHKQQHEPAVLWLASYAQGLQDGAPHLIKLLQDQGQHDAERFTREDLEPACPIPRLLTNKRVSDAMVRASTLQACQLLSRTD